MEEREVYETGKPQRMIEIKLSRCLLCLTERELQTLLARDPELWAMALRRGKSTIRGRQARRGTTCRAER